jgi:hypothetical protein
MMVFPTGQFDVDFGSDGDDTTHKPLPQHRIPFYVQSTIIPSKIQDDDVVDLIFTNFSSSGVFPRQIVDDRSLLS